ncbi:MAG: ABC transporter substrate-binding protein, partial [Solirubrobacteraceae bacterium]
MQVKLTSRRSGAALASVAAVAAIALAGCGSSSGTKSGTTASNGKAGGTSNKELVIAESADPVSLNPLQQRVTSTYSVLRNMYDPLIEFGHQGTEYTSFTPVLATSWHQISPTELHFTLRKGVTFDNGQPFNAKSVVYTVEALLGKLPKSEPSLAAYLFPSLTKAVATGPYGVTLYTKTPTSSLLAALTQLLIVPANSSTGPSGKLAKEPDGTGPYKMVSYTPAESLVMEAKPNYFLGAASIKKITWKTIASESAELAALLSGSVNLVYGLGPSNVKTVEGNSSDKVDVVPSTRVAALWLNTLENPYLKNVKVRQALNYAVDKSALVKSPLEGLATPVATLVPSYFKGYDSSVKPYPYEPSKAKALLKEAGYPNGFPLTIMVPSTHYVLGPQIVQVIASELQQVGIKVKIEQVSFSDFATVTAKRTIPGSFYGAWGSTFPDPLQMFQTIVSGGTTGFSWFNDPTVNNLIDKAAVASNESEYLKSLEGVQTQIATQAPFVYLFVYKDAWGMSKELKWTPPSTEVQNMYYA